MFHSPTPGMGRKGVVPGARVMLRHSSTHSGTVVTIREDGRAVVKWDNGSEAAYAPAALTAI